MYRRLFGLAALILMLGTTPLVAGTVYVPLATNSETAAGTFETQLIFTNTADVGRTAELYLIETNTDGTDRPMEPEFDIVRFGPGQTLTYTPVDAGTTGGLLEITLPPSVLVQARLVSIVDGEPVGTGSRIPVITSDNLVAADETLNLQGLMKGDGYITDFGLVNMGSAGASCSVDVFNDIGTPLIPRAVLTLDPLSQRQFDDVFGLLGHDGARSARIDVSCDQSFYAYGVLLDDTNGESFFSSPSASGDSLLSKPGEVEPCPPGSECFEFPGIVHIPTRGNPVKRIEFPFSPGIEFKSIRVKMQVKHGGWFSRNPGGIHNFFWLARNRYRSNTFGYVNVRGPNRDLVSMLTNVNLPAGVTQRLTSSVSLIPGATYTLDYFYDTNDGRIELAIMDSSGRQIVGLVDRTNVRRITTEGSGFIMDIGLREVDSDVPTFGWEYANLQVFFNP